MDDHQTASHQNPMEGWKTIAAYFRRGTRTVQVWEQQCGLPIHRFQGRVLAYPAELDEWRRGREIGPALRQTGVARGDGSQSSADGEVHPGKWLVQAGIVAQSPTLEEQRGS